MAHHFNLASDQDGLLGRTASKKCFGVACEMLCGRKGVNLGCRRAMAGLQARHMAWMSNSCNSCSPVAGFGAMRVPLRDKMQCSRCHVLSSSISTVQESNLQLTGCLVFHMPAPFEAPAWTAGACAYRTIRFLGCRESSDPAHFILHESQCQAACQLTPTNG